MTAFLERGARRSRESPSFASQSDGDDDKGGRGRAAVRIHGLSCLAGWHVRNSANDESMMEKEEDGLWSQEEEGDGGGGWRMTTPLASRRVGCSDGGGDDDGSFFMFGKECSDGCDEDEVRKPIEFKFRRPLQNVTS